jgi:hypothetical protein
MDIIVYKPPFVQYYDGVGGMSRIPSTIPTQVKAKTRYEVVDIKSGRVVESRESEDPLLTNWIALIGSMLSAGASRTIINTGGTVMSVRVRHLTNLTEPIPILDILAPAGDDSYGIVLSSTAGAKAMNRYNVASKIPHQAGVFEYKAMEDLGCVAESTMVRCSYRRTFDNLGATTVNIAESGIIAILRAEGEAPGTIVVTSLLILLDIPDTPVSVASLQRLVVTVDIFIPVPSGWTIS